MNKSALLALWESEELKPFQGWDFSHLKGRVRLDNPPWDYMATARARVAAARSILDMATGGGEVFSQLGPFLGSATAMEGYAPNVALAEKRLQPLGVKVVACGEAGPYPFADSSFDLILNRHGGLWSPEVGRITRNDGILVTEQVGGCLEEVQTACGASRLWAENSLPFVSDKLISQGFEILEGRNWTGKVRYRDVGALVYELKATPWLVPDFSVKKYMDVLFKYQELLEQKGELAFDSTYFWIVAKKT